VKIAQNDRTHSLVECFLNGNLLVGAVDTQIDITLVRDEVAQKLKLAVNDSDVLSLKGYGSVNSG